MSIWSKLTTDYGLRTTDHGLIRRRHQPLKRFLYLRSRLFVFLIGHSFSKRRHCALVADVGQRERRRSVDRHAGLRVLLGALRELVGPRLAKLDLGRLDLGIALGQEF